MADLSEFNFDASTHEPSKNEGKKEFELIPDGTYKAVVVDSDVRNTADETGKYIELAFQIIDGPQEKRMIWEKFHLVNKSAQAVKYSKDRYAAFQQSVGVINPSVTEEFHNIVLEIKIGKGLNKKKNKDENRIYGYSKSGSGGGNTTAIPQTTHQEPVTGSATPWKNR